MYLESIFIGGDIRAQLPEEAKKFDNIDKLFRKIMTETTKNPQVVDACHAQNRHEDLQTISTGLEKCQKSLNDYLDSKRNAFPRFFFISDEELLSILGNHECTCVQEHMIKVYLHIAIHAHMHTYTHTWAYMFCVIRVLFICYILYFLFIYIFLV